MKNEFVLAIRQLCAEKGVPEAVVMEAIEAALVSAYKRNFDSAGQNIVAEIDPASGAVRMFAEQHVAEPVEGEEAESHHITVEEAQQTRPDAKLGDVLRTEVTPQHFGRIAAQTAKQVVLQKLREAERKMIYDQFAERKDEIVHGIVQRIEQGNVVVELGKAEAVMPRSEQVSSERYYPGQRIRVYVAEVHDTNRGPQIIVSRAHRFMLRRLFEQEVPEIFNGTVEIKAIAREAGARSKVGVEARQTGIDPVGACVGMRGVRIQNIVNELGGEKIDVVEWDEDPGKFVANALSPAQVLSVEVDEEEKTARVVVPERQLSLAIGKEGQNARLAAKLTGWRIDIKSDVAAAAQAERALQEPVEPTGAAEAVQEPADTQDAEALAETDPAHSEAATEQAEGAGETTQEPPTEPEGGAETHEEPADEQGAEPVAEKNHSASGAEAAEAVEPVAESGPDTDQEATVQAER